jgi:D-methionine transport system substrate-binding protein
MRIIISIFMLITTLSACNQQQSPNTLVIGTIAGPETELVNTAAEVAKARFDITVKVVEFNDYNLPNTALNDGSLDANIYQHLPYLTAANEAHHYHLIPLGKTFLYPVGLYSKKYTSFAEIPDHATIAIPNDPSNEARAFMLLQQAHVITLKATSIPGLHDVEQNPHHLQFKLLDAAQLPRVLPDVDAAIINTTFAIPAGLNPAHDALLIENTDSPYVNIMVIKENSPKREKLEQFIAAFHSDEVKEKAKNIFGDAAIPAW